MRALLLHQAHCPNNLSNPSSCRPPWMFTQLSRKAAAARREITAQSTATEAGTHKCASSLQRCSCQSVHVYRHVSLHSVADPCFALSCRWVADTEAAPSNTASQEFPDNGGMRICVNSTYDSGNIEVTQHSSATATGRSLHA